jgi:hypothetical protein
MPLVEGITVAVRSLDPIQHCEICGEYQLQMLREWLYDGDVRLPAPEYEHEPSPCVVCVDKIEKGEIDAGELRDAA